MTPSVNLPPQKPPLWSACGRRRAADHQPGRLQLAQRRAYGAGSWVPDHAGGAKRLRVWPGPASRSASRTASACMPA